MGSPERANHHYTEVSRGIDEHKHGEYRQIDKLCDHCGKEFTTNVPEVFFDKDGTLSRDALLQFDLDADTITRLMESATCGACTQEKENY